MERQRGREGGRREPETRKTCSNRKINKNKAMGKYTYREKWFPSRKKGAQNPPPPEVGLHRQSIWKQQHRIHLFAELLKGALRLRT